MCPYKQANLLSGKLFQMKALPSFPPSCIRWFDADADGRTGFMGPESDLPVKVESSFILKQNSLLTRSTQSL
jgi:hypothetical protein